MSVNSQLGVKKETTYGTAVVVDRFFEFTSEGITLDTGRAVSEGFRASQRVARSDRFVPYVAGASGSIELDVLSGGFGFWLEHMLGTVATTGPTDTAAYTHTGTVGDLFGKSFTCQVDRRLGAAGSTAQAFTWEGGKVAKWTLECETEGLLTFSADLVFEDEKTATALASASYPSSVVPLSWAGASASIASTGIPVTKWSVSCDNQLKTDRHYLANNTRRSEPVEEGLREITVEVECDWSDLTQYNRFAAETQSGTLAALSLVAQAPSVLTGAATTKGSLTVTLPAVRFDSVEANVSGRDLTTQSISGVALDNGSAAPISVAYVSADVTA